MTMSTFKIFTVLESKLLIAKVLCLLYLSQTAIGIPTGTLKPRRNDVLEGNSAVFTCTVNGGDSGDDIRWQGLYYYDSFLRVAWDYAGISMSTTSFSVNSIIDVSLGLNLLTFGNYSISYSQNMENQDVSQLSIANTTKYDGYFQFSCRIGNEHTQYIIGNYADLTVWTRPASKPQCCFQGDIPDVIPNHEVYQITLTCSLQVGYPPPYLNWLSDRNGHYSQIGSTGFHNISIVQDITASDHGREYICKADILAIPDDPLTCSIIPYNPVPIVSVSFSEPILEPGSTISIFCNNTGASTPDTHYLWYINSTLVNASNHQNIEITEAKTHSSLNIGNSTFLPNNTKFTCEGVIPLIARANASLTVTSGKMKQPKISSTVTNEAFAPWSLDIVIIAAASGGGFVIIILVLLICCVMKCKRSGQVNDKENIKVSSHRNSQSKQKNSNEVTQCISNEGANNGPVYATPNKGKQDSENQKSPESSRPTNTSQSGIPIYALPNKSKKTHTKEGSSNTNKDAKPKNKITDSSTSLYDDVNTINDNADEVQKTSKVNRNAEGLNYADLEIASSARGSGVTEDIIRTENVTVYSEVKM